MDDFKIYEKRFLDNLYSIKNYSCYTVLNYQEDLDFFYDYLRENNLKFLKIEYQDIRDFYSYLDSKHYSKNTISRHISCLRGFYKYLALNKYIESNPFSLATLPKKDKLLPKFLYYNELEEMFDAIDITTDLGKRNRAILELLYATGVRVSELVDMKVDDLNFNDQSIKVLGKGNKERLVYFGPYAEKYVKQYLIEARLNLLKNNKSDYLFINNMGTPLSTRGVAFIIQEIIKRTSIKSNITPHTIRHTFATHLLNEGCDILSVQSLLGHESLKATQVYTHITNDELKDIYLKCHPRSNK